MFYVQSSIKLLYTMNRYYYYNAKTSLGLGVRINFTKVRLNEMFSDVNVSRLNCWKS